MWLLKNLLKLLEVKIFKQNYINKLQINKYKIYDFKKLKKLENVEPILNWFCYDSEIGYGKFELV